MPCTVTRALTMPQVVEDKTFGLKNKNKSKVVQNFVAQVCAGCALASFPTGRV